MTFENASKKYVQLLKNLLYFLCFCPMWVPTMILLSELVFVIEDP